MTAQMNDSFIYDGTDFSVAGISEGKLFDPAILDMEPVSFSTACWRGYQVVYAVVDCHLVAAELHVNLVEKKGDNYERQVGPSINGVVPEGPDEAGFDRFNNHYTGINYHFEYSGGLLLADGFHDDLYVHMGFQSVWKYDHVLELVFDQGVLTAEYDRSEKMAEIRDLILHSDDESSWPMPSDEILAFIEQAFNRKYTWGIF